MAAFALHQRYHLQHSADLTSEQITALSQVYLPIIGHDAFVLYMVWQTMPKESGLLNHTQLMNMTNLGLKTFESSRHQLEGLGLVKTYQQDLSNETQWTYVLQSPMTMPQFLSDRLLTSLLTHYIGESSVQQLVLTVQKQQAEPAGKNVSRSFFDIIGDNAFTPLQQAPMSSKTPTLVTKPSTSEQLDLKLMAQMLSSFAVPLTELKAKENELLIEKKLYGLSDTELVRLIQQHLNVDHTIDISALRKTLQKNVMANQKKPLTSVSDQKPVEQPSNNKNVKPANAAEALMQQVRTASPITFLQALRQHNNGFITDAEVKLLNDIAQLNTLPNEVINVLLYELTVTQKKTTINRNYMQTIVNDWAQAKLKTAPAAFEYLKARSSKQREQATQPAKTYYKQPARRHVQEKRPDWSKQTVAKVSTADKEAAAKMMAEFENEKKE